MSLRTSRQSKQPSTEGGKEERSVVNLAREEEIKHRAYEIYLERGEQSGHELDDWLQTEREIRSSHE